MSLKLQTRQVTRYVLNSALAKSLAHPHGIDRYLEQINPLWSVSEVRARITRISHGTRNSVTLTLLPNANWVGFKAGQYVQLVVDVKGVRRTRCYSLAGSVHRTDRQIELTIRTHDKGLVSQHLKQHAKVGQILSLSQAQGDFCLPKERPSRILLISGGSGITPMMAMLRTLRDESYQGQVVFLHYAPDEASLLYSDAMKEYERSFPALKLIRVLTRQSVEAEGQAHFCLDQLKALVPDYTTFETFVCGPQSLMAHVEQIWHLQNIRQRLHQERFTAVTRRVPDGEVPHGTVQFTRSDRTVTSDGHSLLALAETAGLTPKSGCRMGLCASCTCQKVEGIVFNQLTGTYSTEPNESIRICVNVPVGNVAIDL